MKKYTQRELTALSKEHPIIAFDGVCNLCNGFIEWLIKQDKKAKFRYATLQSASGQLISSDLAGDLDTVVLLYKGKIYTHSDVALLSAKELGGGWTALYGLIIFPKRLRDFIYNWVARNRYKWFGKSQACMIPTPEVKKLFL